MATPRADRLGELEPEPPPAPRREPSAVRPHESGFVLGMAIAPGVVGAMSLVFSFIPFLSGSGTVPRGLITLLLVQIGVIGILRAAELQALMRSWISTLIASVVLVPLLALQVTLLREPYVSWSRHSASPAMVATLVVAMVLLVGAVWTVATSWEEPDAAGLLFLPQAMVVPALIGMRSTIMERPALELLGKVLLLAALATAISWVLSPAGRLLAPPVAVAVEFLILWMTGYGPWFHATSGDIVRVLYSLMLTITVILVVAVPFASMWVRQGADTARQVRSRPARTQVRPSPPQRPSTAPEADTAPTRRADRRSSVRRTSRRA